jgi:alkaline phosphatase D
MNRRDAIKMAAAMGAALAWRPGRALASLGSPTERLDLFPQGVASGDPQATSVLLWTRRPPSADGSSKRLRLEVSEDPRFDRIVARGDAALSADSDWTCRVLAAGLRPHREYWYRFVDEREFSSRVGRTITAPSDSDARPVRFAFVSCQNVQLGACNAYRRMLWEDERRDRAEQLDFVLHLGDFVYEIVWYPEDRPQGYYSRRIRDIVRYRRGEKHADFHVPTTVDDYRALYCAYLADPDLQDARARWPFVCMPDNHEFSWKGWQSQENFGTGVLPAQTRKVAANQAWFEYQPARLAKPGQREVTRFEAPSVSDARIASFDENGLGLETSNLAAIASLRPNRSLRWGANVDLILTDNRSHRSEPLTDRAEAAPFKTAGFPAVVSQEVTEILDAGREFNGGNPPATIRFAGNDVPNPRRASPPLSMLGAEQKRWFVDRLRSSRAPWKLWGNSVAMLDWRTDFQNLPSDLGVTWPATGYALFGDDDWSGYRHERTELLDLIRREGITGVVTLCGDRHSFLAGEVSTTSASTRGSRVVAEFVTGSISAPGLAEAVEYGIPKGSPLRAVYVYDGPNGAAPQAAVNLSITHGVRSSLTMQRTGDLAQALSDANHDVAPDMAFADVGGHGYAVVRADVGSLDVEFVCLPRPIERSDRPDGGDVAYRVTHQAKLWRRGEAPRVVKTASSGVLPLGSVNARDAARSGE